MKSWKTTLFGVLGLMAALVQQFYPALGHHAAFVAALASGLGLIFARDHDTPPPDQPQPIPIRTVAALLLLTLCLGVLMSGCSRFHSVQLEIHPDGSRTQTKQSITTFFDSKTEIAKVRATTTDKTQGLTVGGFSAESSGSNTVELLDRVTKAAVSAAVSAASGKP